EVLRELSEKHPYSSIYSLLYLQGVSRFQSVHLDEVLPKQAYKLSDRTRLFHLLHAAFEGEAIIENEEQSQLLSGENEEVNNEPVITPEITPLAEVIEEKDEQSETAIPEVGETAEAIPETVTEPEVKDIFDFETVAATLSQDYLETSIQDEK